MLSLLTRILPFTPVRFEDRFQGWPPVAGRCLAALAVIILAGMTLAGCGSSSTSEAKAGPISMANASGSTAPASALSIGSKLTLSMMPTNDTANAGVDWTVTCGGNPITGIITNGACGTFTPAHTADGVATVFTAPSVAPIGAAATVTATVTSNPSQSSRASLTVVTVPVAVAFYNTPASSLKVSTVTHFAAVTTNDPLAAGISWTATCGSPACGSFNPATSADIVSVAYTAPATVPVGGTVTITATSVADPTKSSSTTVAITGPPPPPPPSAPIAVSVLPGSISVQQTGPGRSANVTAVVFNDSGSGGVDWTLSCSASSCGAISSHTASGASAGFSNTSGVAVGGTITITATSTSDPSKSASTTATVVAAAPIEVTMSTTLRLPTTLNTGSQAKLAAVAAPDTGNAGINWTATCGSAGACGTFNLSPAHTASNAQIIYTAPASVPSGVVVAITAASAVSGSSNPAVAATTIVAAPPPPPSLSFIQAPPGALVSTKQLPIGVTITNDTVPGGVTWSAQCGSTVPGGCGWFIPAHSASGTTATYTAPPVTSSGNTVILTATSVGNPTIHISSNPISINPDTTLEVAFVPSLPSQVQTDATISLNAAVSNDASNAGVDWQVCANGCGFFTTRPATPEIPATATTPYVPSSPAVTATTVSGWPNGSPILYTAPTQVPTNETVAVVASAHVDPSAANSGAIAITPVPATPALNGAVQAGNQPVVGASVGLYAAGIAGYASASAQIVAALPTDKNGNFSIPAGFSCPKPNSQMYLLASGGNVGSNSPNPNLALMTALGSCSNLSSSPVVLNEVTTIASAFAAAPFAANDALTGNSSYLYIGTSSSNLIGLANAFSAVNNLVDVSTGKVRFTVPAENAAVPYAEINTLADIVSTCTITAGGVEGDGSPCSTLFTATDLLGTGTFGASIAPSDTLQAVFNIAQHPISNYGYNLDFNDPSHLLFAIAPPASPFQPILTSPPSDWSLSLNYTSGGGLSKASKVGSFAIDGSGNLWITDTHAGSVIEWNALGAALSPSTGFPAGGGPIAIDATNNVWISGNGALYELTSLGSPLPWSPFGGVSGGGQELAIDALNNLWIANTAGVNEFSNLGQQLSPPNGYGVNGVSNLVAVGIDSSNNVWFGSPGEIVELTNPGGQVITSGPFGAASSQMAADGVGDVWYIGGGGGSICEAPPYAGKGSTLGDLCNYVQGGIQVTNGVNVVNPRGVALDGAGTLWVASQGGPVLGGTVSPGVLPVVPGGPVASATPYEASSVAAGPLRVAVDGSGNVWVLIANNTVTEYVGAATPVVTPIALGAQKKALATRP